MSYTVISNNPLANEELKRINSFDFHYIDGTVQEVLNKCEELFSKGKYCLAADPMGGRRARPFPYLTLILEAGGNDAGIEDWNRIADYAMLNIKRMNEYVNNSDELNEDYRILDYSLTKTALKIY